MNKMFKKIFAVVAACATVATMSISAFAAGETASHEAGSVSVNGYAAVSGATQYTVMVFEDSFAPAYTDVTKIFYINQDSNPTNLLTGMLVKGGELAVGDYTVRIGNDAGDAIDVDLKVVADVQTTKLVFGDVNGDGNVTASDATFIAAFFAGGSANVGGAYAIGDAIGETGLVFGDVSGDGNVTASDATFVAAFFAGGSANVGGTYAIGAEYEAPVK